MVYYGFCGLCGVGSCADLGFALVWVAGWFGSLGIAGGLCGYMWLAWLVVSNIVGVGCSADVRAGVGRLVLDLLLV